MNTLVSRRLWFPLCLVAMLGLSACADDAEITDEAAEEAGELVEETGDALDDLEGKAEDLVEEEVDEPDGRDG
ncbi:MAG: hypothetical protein EA419_09080 [Wenzhouxiangella sp.]|nr:MAG: hypothetical protein EA419_09080 [Wenzhouxiangella sp.]